MRIRKILCGMLAGILLCTGNPVTSQAQTKAQLYMTKEKTRTVTIETSGGTMVRRTAAGGTVTLPADRNGSDYTFLGWSSKKNQTCNPQYQAYETIRVTKNMHLYPVKYYWSQEPDVNVRNLAVNLSKYSRVIFVGDSRTVMMRQTLYGQYGEKISSKVSFVCKVGEGLGWMKNTAEASLIKELEKEMADETDDCPVAVIFNLGVNDLIHRRESTLDYKAVANQYVTYMNELSGKLATLNVNLFYMSVNPLNTAMKPTRKESEVRGFNEILRHGLNADYSWIDTYSYLIKRGYTTHNEFRGGLDDGLHYSKKTYKRIYSLVMKNLRNS